MRKTTSQLNKILPYIVCAILAVALVVVPLVGFHEIVEVREAARAAARGTPEPAPLAQFTAADQSAHPALLALGEDGTFGPAKSVSRGELAQGLAAILTGLPPAGEQVFSDVPADSPLYEPAGALAAAGLWPAEEDGTFQPDRPVTQRELTELINALSERMTGLDRARAEGLILAAEGGGLFGGQTDGDMAVTRGTLAQVLVRLAGRTPEEGLLLLAERVPPDVSTEDANWPYIADAVTEGEIPRREPGLYRIGGWLYAAGEDGELLRDTTTGVWTFGPDGRYTTGDKALDECLKTALDESGASALTGQDALQAAYLYIKREYEYLVSPLDMEPEEDGATGWEYERALRFFRYGGGTCYGYAAAFGLMARCLGEDAKIVSARINQYDWPHSMVVIPADGQDWIYDVELEDTRPERHADLELFHILNYEIYSYWYTPNWSNNEMVSEQNDGDLSFEMRGDDPAGGRVGASPSLAAQEA